MTVLFNYLSISLSGAALLLSVVGLWFTAVMPGIDRWSKRFFVGYFLIFMLGFLFGIFEMAFQSINIPSAAFKLYLGLESLLLALPLPMLTVYLLHCCSESIRPSKLFHAVLG